ncbi:MAG: C10 family peptidase [Bacteroidetes bacterium]|nr:C10 family peptidase [Bacteroidota bacterium]
MKYWNHPQQGNGSHGYNSDYGYEYANFGNTTYNWASMPNSVNSSNSSVAELMYHCGVSVEMDYGPTSSSASTSDVEDALEDYFYYSTSADVKDRTWYSTSAWKNMIINEIDNNRPMQYRGANYWNNGGHSFICDGYLGDYFHFNWGWGGSYDGWFDIDDLEPGGYNFKYNHKMIIGIEPIPTPPPAPSWLIAQTLSSTSINITYENVVNEDGYEVYYSTSPSGSYTSIGTVGANSCYVDITGLNPNTQYCFKVKAYNSAGSSCFSPYDCDITDDIPPSAPSSLTATTASSSQINVAWSNVSNEDGYKIYRATSSGGSYSQIGTTGANVTSYPDNGLPSNTEYCYKVKAYNSAGNSGFSPYDCATTNDPTNISDVILNKIIKIYPNPAKDILYIETTGSGLFIKNIEIFSGIGKSVYRSDFDNTNNLIKIPLTNFHPGIYFIKTQTNNGIITRKIIIQH